MALRLTEVQVGRNRRSVLICTGMDFRVRNLVDSTPIMYRVGDYVRGGMLAGSNLVMTTDGTTVRIWDDARREESVVSGANEYGTVQRLLMCNKMAMVVGEKGLLLYSVPKMSIYGQAKVPLCTGAEVCDMDREGTVMVHPGRAPGVLHVESLGDQAPKIVYEVRAHQHALRLARLSDNGKLVATASTRGTLVRVFDVGTSNRVAEFRVSANLTGNNDIHGLEFDGTGTLLLVSCGRTVHVFSLHEASRELGKEKSAPESDPSDPAELVASTLSAKPTPIENTRSLMRYMPLAPAYYNSTWSARQYDMDLHTHVSFDGGFVCGFTEDNSHIAVLTKSGTRFLFPFLNTGQLAPADLKPAVSKYA